MHILVLTATYTPSLNGVAISTQRSVEELRNKGHRVTVIYPQPKKPMQTHRDDVQLPSIFLPFLSDYPISIPGLYAIDALFASNTFDIMHVHHPIVWLPWAFRLRNKYRVPVVFTYHTRYPEYVAKFLWFFPSKLVKMYMNKYLLAVLNSCDAVIATTKFYRKMLKMQSNSRIYYVSTAALKKIMQSSVATKTLRKRLGLPNDRTILLNVSRHVEEKNLTLLLQAMALLPEKYVLVLVGEGSYTTNLKQECQRLDLERKVIFAGLKEQTELAEYYSCADLFVYSSLTDTIGINLIEAFSAGLPVIAVKDENVEEVVVHQNTGIISGHSPQEFANSILQFPEKKRADFAKQARAMADTFSIEHTTSKLLSMYKKVITHAPI